MISSQPAFGELDEITVTADRIKEERERMARASNSVLIQPQESSRFDTATQLKRESSLTFVETGRVSPSGFIIPKIRGQDSKLTDVYLEDTLLQDPYSGLPLVEDLDIRAFGSLELHQGVSPVGVPNINPIGTIRYRFNTLTRSRASVGVSTGSPYGYSIWGLGIHKKEDQELRLYARTHQTSGRYPYYSDQGTPYNERDDKKKSRTNNDQRSQQFIPVYRKTWGPYSVQALGWFYESDRGIASNNMVFDSLAREASKGYLSDVQLSRSWVDVGPLETVELGGHAGKTKDHRDTDDPSRRVLNSSRQASMEVSSDRQGIHLKSATELSRTTLSYEQSQSKIKQSYDGFIGTSLTRRNGVGLLGVALSPWNLWLLELKHSQQQQTDRTDEKTKIVLEDELSSPESKKKSRANTLSLAFGDFEDGIYGQLARTERLPSLFEEFGNGSSVRPNQNLKPEKIYHREIGVFTTLFGVEWGAAAYEDRTDQKIVFVPIQANSSKALNVAKTEISGYDGSITWQGESTGLTFKISELDALDKSKNKARTLPGIPARITVMEWRQQWAKPFSSYVTSRYRSEIYRDLANSIKLPGSVIYDLNLDYKYRRFELGFALRNLANTTDVEIASGASKGRTSFSDFAGAPLPGRQWILSLVYTTED